MAADEVTVENLETVVRCHVERMLNVLDGDVTFRHAIDVIPKLLCEDFFRRIQRALVNDPRHDLALWVQQASGLQQLPLRVEQTAGHGCHRFTIRVHSFLGRIEDRLELGHRNLQRLVAGSHVGQLGAGCSGFADRRRRVCP